MSKKARYVSKPVREKALIRLQRSDRHLDLLLNDSHLHYIQLRSKKPAPIVVWLWL